MLRAERDYASSLCEIGRYRIAISNLEKLLTSYEKLTSDSTFPEHATSDNHDVLLVRSELADAYTLDGKHGEALEQRRIVFTERSRDDNDHLETIRAKEKVAISHSNLGQNGKAMGIRVNVMEEYKALQGRLPPSYPGLLATMFNLARNYEDSGYVEKAFEMYNEVLSSRLSLMKQRHDDRCRLQGCKVSSHGLEEKGVLLCETTHSADLVVGSDRIVETLEALAFAFKTSNKISKALSMRDFIHKICLVKLAKSDRIQDKALAKHFRSEAFACQNRLVSVLETADEKIFIRKQILESQEKFVGYNIKTMETMVDISCNYMEKGNHESARKYSHKVLEFERQFDEAYPHVFESALAVWKAAEPFPSKTTHNTPTVEQQSRTLPLR
jgi:tetratricopeptide (TPR) repeat protein